MLAMRRATKLTNGVVLVYVIIREKRNNGAEEYDNVTPPGNTVVADVV